MQSTKCQTEGRHNLAPLGRMRLAAGNSVMMLTEHVSLTQSCLPVATQGLVTSGSKRGSITLTESSTLCCPSICFWVTSYTLTRHSPCIINILQLTSGINRCIRYGYTISGFHGSHLSISELSSCLYPEVRFCAPCTVRKTSLINVYLAACHRRHEEFGNGQEISNWKKQKDGVVSLLENFGFKEDPARNGTRTQIYKMNRTK